MKNYSAEIWERTNLTEVMSPAFKDIFYCQEDMTKRLSCTFNGLVYLESKNLHRVFTG